VNKKHCLHIAIAVVLLIVTSRPSTAAAIPNTATLSGTIQASKPFQAAEVFVRNVDKNILYMVYTSGGRYRAVNLFPGSYEVSVEKRGFSSPVQKIAIGAGESANLNLSLTELEPDAAGKNAYIGPAAIREEVSYAPYEELYPPGPGRKIAEDTCTYCHGPNLFPRKQWTEKEWNAAIDLMTNPKGPVGAIVSPGKLTPEDRKVLVEYLTKNFGPENKKRVLKLDQDFPLDEKALANAEYIEYYLPMDPKLDANNKRRVAQDPHFDSAGNVWYTDRSIPNRVGKVDPRTGEFKDYVLPDPKGDPHGLTVDGRGHVWWSETRGLHLGRLDPKSGEMTRYSMDVNGAITGGQGHTPIMDSKQNVWFSVIVGNRIGKWDRLTEKVTLFEPPTPNSFPYGIVRDKQENIYLAEFTGCKAAKFDVKTEKWTEYVPLTKPCLMRRLSVDSKGTIWYALYGGGKIGKIDQKTGKIVEYAMPMPYGEPYDIWPDAHDTMWISDGGQGGALIKFDPQTEKFTYYPSPQRTDQPKLEITRDGAIWYCPRSSEHAAVGVLFPDVTKITTLAAYY